MSVSLAVVLHPKKSAVTTLPEEPDLMRYLCALDGKPCSSEVGKKSEELAGLKE